MNASVILSKVSVEVLIQQEATCTTLKHEATQCCTAALYKTHEMSQTRKTWWTGDCDGKPYSIRLL